MRLSSTFAALAAFVSAAAAMRLPVNATLARRQDAGPKKVFAHFMLGIVASYEAADWEKDIAQAKAVGIDGFALNAGTDTYTPTQLKLAYDAAAKVGGFELFISFDFSSFNPTDPGPVADLIKQFANEPAQLKVGDKTFVSSFIGDNFPFRQAESQSGVSLFSCPAWGPDALKTADADCGFQWNAWPSQDNKPIDAPMTTDGDKWWIQNLAGKPYMAAVSPWFFTHYGPDTWNKNWLFKSDTLWTDRWQQVLDLAPQFVEIITWNDFGESHYIGPLHDDDGKDDVYAGGATGAKRWVPGHDHSHWATVAAPYIAAYKAGAADPAQFLDGDHVVYYYRPQSKSLQCADSVPPPEGADIVADDVFVTAMLTAPGTIVITSGGNAPVSIDVEAGIHTVSAPMGVGKQTFALVRGGATVMQGDGYQEIKGSCDVYDFNTFVGEISGGGAPSPAPAPAPEEPAKEEPAPPVVETPAPAPAPAPTACNSAPQRRAVF